MNSAKSKKIIILFIFIGLLFFLEFSLGSFNALSQNNSIKCIFCNKTNGLTLLQYYDGNHYVCSNCIKTLKKCSTCYLPTNQNIRKDKRIICEACQKTGVFKPEQIETIYREVQAYICNSFGGIAVTPPPFVKIVDLDEISFQFNEGSGRNMEIVGFYRPYDPEQIYILSGYQAITCASTLCHEYTHAWQSRNCPPQDRALKEGFASWVQYKYLLSKRENKKAECIRNSTQPDYGDGVRKCLELESKLGIPGLIEYVKTQKNF